MWYWLLYSLFCFNVDLLDCEMCMLVVIRACCHVEIANMSSFYNGRNVVAEDNCDSEVFLVVSP
jgi:hypothetical protein